jgi:hypothetical protein
VSFEPCNRPLKISDSNSQSGSSLGSVRVQSFTLSYTPMSMKCDSRASLLAHTFASPCLGCKPKAKVMTFPLRMVVPVMVLHLDSIWIHGFHNAFPLHSKLAMSCPYAWPHTWWPIMGMLIMPLRLMYILRLLYVIRCFRVMACLGFQLCWRLYKRLSSSLLLSVFLEFLC